MPDHYCVSIIFFNCFIIFFGTATVRPLNCLQQKHFSSFKAPKSDTFQSCLIIKNPNIYIIKPSALFVAHAFQLRNTKCFTSRTQFIIVPLLGAVQHDCLYYISRTFLRVKKRGKLLTSNAYNSFLNNFLEGLCKQFFYKSIPAPSALMKYNKSSPSLNTPPQCVCGGLAQGHILELRRANYRTDHKLEVCMPTDGHVIILNGVFFLIIVQTKTRMGLNEMDASTPSELCKDVSQYKQLILEKTNPHSIFKV